MSFQFGDGFDCYTSVLDMFNGYWDVGNAGASETFATGRFSGSRAIVFGSSSSNNLLTKASGVNDAVHHFVVAFQQTAAITGSTLGLYLQLLDGTTGQCAIVFRSDGAILLTSGTAAGTVLATYTGAFPVVNTWYAFEIEVFISNTAGYMNVRKNGNTVNDFTSATNLDTQNSANAYANKLQMNQQGLVNQQLVDDLYWRSDASSVAWMGDIRCYTRAPASDASVQFSRTPTGAVVTQATTTTSAVANGVARYTTFTATYDGTISTGVVPFGTGYTGNLKTTIFADASGSPGAVLGSANIIVNPAAGVNTITFAVPVAVTKGTVYWIGFASDTSSGSFNAAAGSTGKQSNTTYANFPVALPSASLSSAVGFSVTIGVSSNATVVSEPQQDATTSYVYDSVPGHADLYGIAAIASTPLTTYAVTTRAYAIKSDAGTRTMAVQLKSGSSTVASPTVVLTPSNWQWAWRHDTTDPATGAAWTATAVNVAQTGPIIIA